MPERIDIRRVRAVVFDVDGTLYRQAPLRRTMATRLARAHALRPRHGWRTMRALSAYRHAQESLRSDPAGAGLAQSQLRVAAERTGLDEAVVAAAVTAWMEEAPLAVLGRHTRPGLVELLDSLEVTGVRRGVLSDYAADAKLAALGVDDRFDVVVCAQDPEVGVFKPHPRGLQVALERLGVDPTDALYIGDRVEVDAAAAAAAGVPCAIFAPPARADAPAGPPYLSITSFDDLRDRLVPA